MLAATVRVAGDLDLAEECTQDAYVRALETWRRDGVPDNPGGWLTTAARNRALDSHRRAAILRTKLALLAGDTASAPPADSELADADEIVDDRLRLVFTCCHPALAREAQVALTLRLVCGLTTQEIAHSFLVGESTMAARVTRAKKKIEAARIPYRVPAAHELAERLDAVLTVIHLVFTAGHTASTGPHLVRAELTERALDLARTLRTLMPDERELTGLLALMVFTTARAATRSTPDGGFVPLEEQDRGRWDREAIEEGHHLVRAALRGGRPGRFALQGAIAGLHAEAASVETTAWDQVVTLYDLLLRAWPSPVVALNRAVAIGFRDGPSAGLDALDAVVAAAAGDRAASALLDGYHYLPACRADLLRRAGRPEEARTAYRAALRLVDNDRERAFLQGRLNGLD